MAVNLDTQTTFGQSTSSLSVPLPQLREPTVVGSTDITTRRWIAYVLLVVMGAVIAAAFYALFTINSEVTGEALGKDAADDAERLMKIVNVIFGPVVTLVSSVVGFYFGARTAKEGANG